MIKTEFNRTVPYFVNGITKFDHTVEIKLQVRQIISRALYGLRPMNITWSHF